MTKDEERALTLKLDMMAHSVKSQLKQTEERLQKVIAGLSIVMDTKPEPPPLPPLTRSQSVLLRLGFARFRWFRRRVGGRWCYRRMWLNLYPHSPNIDYVYRWERHPTATMGEDIVEVEQYEMMKLPEARLVDRS